MTSVSVLEVLLYGEPIGTGTRRRTIFRFIQMWFQQSNGIWERRRFLDFAQNDGSRALPQIRYNREGDGCRQPGSSLRGLFTRVLTGSMCSMPSGDLSGKAGAPESQASKSWGSSSTGMR